MASKITLTNNLGFTGSLTASNSIGSATITTTPNYCYPTGWWWTETSTDWWWRETPIINYPIYYNYPIHHTPEIKAIEIKGKVLFYYYDENKNLFFTVYGKSKKMEFKRSDDLIELLKELGLFE